jgi:hypothetical protein
VNSFSEGYTCPRNYNPADFYIHKLAIMPTEKNESIARSAVSYYEPYLKCIKK